MDDKGYEAMLRSMSPSEQHTYGKLIAERNKVMDLKRKIRALTEGLNQRIQCRYDELMAEGKHGHYETMFRVFREELERLQ